MTDKYKTAYKRLKIVFWIYIACLILPITRWDLNGGQAAAYIGIFILAHFGYIYLMGVLIAGTNKSLGTWLVATFFTGPLGVIVSFVKLMPVAIEQDWN